MVVHTSTSAAQYRKYTLHVRYKCVTCTTMYPGDTFPIYETYVAALSQKKTEINYALIKYIQSGVLFFIFCGVTTQIRSC